MITSTLSNHSIGVPCIAAKVTGLVLSSFFASAKSVFINFVALGSTGSLKILKLSPEVSFDCILFNRSGGKGSLAILHIITDG